MRRIRKPLVIIIAVIMIFSVVLVGCNKQAPENEGVAMVNDKVITKADFDRNFDIYKKSYEAQFGTDIWAKDIGNGKTFEEAVNDRVMENLIIEEVILQNAEEMGISVSDEEVQEEIDKYKEMFGTEEDFQNFLEESNMTENYLKEGIKKDLIINQFRDNFIKDIEISDEDAENYYNENKDTYIQVKARHILVDTEEEANNIIEELNSGKDFAELAKEKSQDLGSASNGGDVGYFGKERMYAEFEEAAFSLTVGEISKPVKTSAGYHVIEVQDRIDTFEDVKNVVIEDMKNNKYYNRLEELRGKAKVEILK